MKKCLVCKILLVLMLCLANSAYAVVLFEDNFDMGINDNIWAREQINGTQWESTAGYIKSNTPSSYNWDNRELDIFTEKADFTDFILTFDMKFNNEGDSQDYRYIYLRAGDYATGYAPNTHRMGYWLQIRNWYNNNDSIYLTANNNLGDWKYFEPGNIFPLNNNWYSLKISAIGNSIKFKMWQKGSTEPDAWLFDITDTDNHYTSGRIGFGNYLSADTYVDNVKVNSVNPVPEPTTMLLFGPTLLCLLRYKRKIR